MMPSLFSLSILLYNLSFQLSFLSQLTSPFFNLFMSNFYDLTRPRRSFLDPIAKDKKGPYKFKA